MPIIQYSQSDVDRFWSYVDRSAGPSACWPWLRSFRRCGYGQFHVSGMRNHNIRANRFAWIVTNGQIPQGLCVLHHCDSPPCCNPSHLWLGTHADNMHDMKFKGRSTAGESNGYSKLIVIQVLKIRALYQTGDYSQYALADVFGVSQTNIGDIVNRKTWTHIP